MSNPFDQRKLPEAHQASNTSFQPKVLQPNESPIIIVEGELSGSVAQMEEEENKLQNEKQRLLEIMEDLEKRLMSEIKKKQSSISTLKTEISELQDKCEKLANTLEIPVVK